MNDLDDLGLDTAPATPAAAPAAEPAKAAEEAKPAAAPKGKFKTIYINGIRMRAKSNAGTPTEIESVAQFGVYRGNPRIIVRLNDPNEDSESRDTDYGRVQAAMDYATFEVFLGYIEEACNKTEKWTAPPIDNLSTYKGAQKFDTPQVVNTTLVGRTEDGRIWFCVRDGNRLAPKFVFGPGEYHHLRDIATKGALEPGEASRKYAQATCNVLRRLMPAICGRFLMGEENEENQPAMDVKPADGTDRPQGGGYNNRQGGGGGWQGNRQGGGGGQWGNRGGGGQWGNRQGGGGFNRGGGGGYNRGGGGGGNWNNNRGGGGGGYNNNRGNYGGGGNQAPAADTVADTDIQF